MSRVNLEFTDLEETGNRKILFFGDSETGKTELLFTAPGPLAWFTGGEALTDSFRSRAKREGIKLQGVRPKPPGKEYSDLALVLDAAYEGQLSNYRSLCVDGWTGIEQSYRDEHPIPTEPLGWGDYYKTLERAFFNRLKREYPCHLLVTAQQANQWGENAEGVQHKKDGVVGMKPSGYKNLKYPFDLVFRTTVDRATKQFVAVVDKSRFRDVFPKGEKFPNLTWAKILETVGKRADAPPTSGELKDLWERAGSPNGTLKEWMLSSNLGQEIDGKFVADEAARFNAKDVLEDLIIENAKKQLVTT